MNYRRVNPESVIFDDEVSNNGMPQDTALGYLTNEQVIGLGEAQRKVADSLAARDEQDFNYAQTISALLRGDTTNNRQISSAEKIASEGNKTQIAVNKYSADSSAKTAEQNRIAESLIRKYDIDARSEQERNRLSLDEEIARFDEEMKRKESDRLTKKDEAENKRYLQDAQFKSLSFALKNAQKGIKPTLSPSEAIDIVKAQEAMYRKDPDGQVIGIDVNPMNLTTMSSIIYPSTGLLYASLSLEKPITYPLAGGGTYTLKDAPIAVPKVEDFKRMSPDEQVTVNRIVAAGIKSFVEKTAKAKMSEEDKNAIWLSIYRAYDSYLREEKDSSGTRKHAIYLRKEDEATRTFYQALEKMLAPDDSETDEELEKR